MPTAIQWTDETWNPVTGCTRVSPGCANCYIERTPPFRIAGRVFARVGSAETTGIILHPDRLEQPLHWRKPRRVFVNSLSDLFHEDIPDTYIDKVYGVMGGARQHTFQVLTKRPERALDYYTQWAERIGDPEIQPFTNVWLGVSIENARYTWRADVLREIPAVVRFISAEPLLGSLFKIDRRPSHGVIARAIGNDGPRNKPLDLSGIDWVIIGGESGPGARAFHLEHARELIRECDRENLRRSGPNVDFSERLAVFVKQLGKHPTATWEHDGLRSCRQFGIRDPKGGDWDEWPADLRIREFPRTAVLA